MKTIIEFTTETPDDLRAQSKAVADMHPAMDAFEKAMKELGQTGVMTVRHVRAKNAAPLVVAPLKEVTSHKPAAA